MDSESSSDSHKEDVQVSESSWNKLKNASHSQGYREGLDEGKERSLQAGFDQGYAAGFTQSQRISELKGFLTSLVLKAPEGSESVSTLKGILDKLH